MGKAWPPPLSQTPQRQPLFSAFSTHSKSVPLLVSYLALGPTAPSIPHQPAAHGYQSEVINMDTNSPLTWEAESGGLPVLHSKYLSLKMVST